jgi:hypothetical protein
VEYGKDELTTDVRRCARCGGDHDGMTFIRMQNPIDPGYPFWSLCPKGYGPILLQAVEVTE